MCDNEETFWEKNRWEWISGLPGPIFSCHKFLSFHRERWKQLLFCVGLISWADFSTLIKPANVEKRRHTENCFSWPSLVVDMCVLLYICYLSLFSLLPASWFNQQDATFVLLLIPRSLPGYSLVLSLSHQELKETKSTRIERKLSSPGNLDAITRTDHNNIKWKD